MPKEFKLKLGRGSSLRFLLSKKPKSPLFTEEEIEARQRENDDAIAPVDLPDNYAIRIKKGIFVRWYDMGITRVGEDEWEDLDFQVVPSLSGSIFRSTSGPIIEQCILTVDRFLEASFADFYARLFETPMDEWTNYYWKIPYEVSDETYGFTIRDKTGTNRRVPDQTSESSLSSRGMQWVPSGLKIKDLTQLEHQRGTSPYFAFDTKDEFDLDFFYVTEEYDRDADQVEFVLDKSCDVFMVPRFGLCVGQSIGGYTEELPPTEEVPGGQIHSEVKNHFLNVFYRVAPRLFFPRWLQENEFKNLSPVSDPDGVYADYLNWFKSLPDNRTFTFHRDFLFPIGSSAHSTTVSIGLDGDGSAFPDVETLTYCYLLYWLGSTRNDIAREAKIQPADDETLFVEQPSVAQLCAVIKKGSEWFYVWNSGEGVDVGAEIFQYFSSGTAIYFLNYNGA